MFFLGDRFFGTVTAYVPGEDAGRYHFTSGLAVQLLKALEPELRPLINAPPHRRHQARSRLLPVADTLSSS